MFQPLNAKMTRLIRDKDWSETPLGPRSEWSDALRTSVDVVLGCPHGMVVLWGEDLVQVYNDGYMTVLGAKHPAGLGQPTRECWPELWDSMRGLYERVLKGEIVAFQSLHLPLERGSGPEDAWFDLIYSPIIQQDGRISGILVSVTEQTHRVLAERALRDSERRLAIAIEASGGGVFEHRIPAGPELYLSPRWCEIMGYGKPPVPEREFEAWWASLVHEEDREMRRAAFAEFLEGRTQHHEVDLRIESRSRSWIWIREFAHAVERDEAGQVRHLAGMILDITSEKKAERQIARLANHDPLTGLANRTLFTNRLTAATMRAEKSGQRVGLVMIDLDRLKVINDRLGHVAGDALLREVAERLANAIRRGDTAARIGGDEFAVVLAELPTRELVEELANRICRSLMQPALVEEHMIEIGASLGAAVFPEDGDNVDYLMRHADLALYDAKESGGRRISIFHRGLADAAARRRRVEAELRRGIERGEFVLFYQPQVSVRSGQVRCVEALVRWRRRDSTLVPPGEFISIAEASGAIRALGAWVMGEACRQQARWREDGHDVIVGINVSPAEARFEDFSATLDRNLKQSGIDGSSLELEITEGLLMDPEMQPIQSFLSGCAARSVRLAIDDFGKGYSSLGYLGRLPVSKIKIDRSFVAKIGTAEDELLLDAMIDLGRRLGKRVVAEGVENQSQFEQLKEMGCDDVQGWLFSPPLEAERMTALLRKGTVI